MDIFNSVKSAPNSAVSCLMRQQCILVATFVIEFKVILSFLYSFNTT